MILSRYLLLSVMVAVGAAAQPLDIVAAASSSSSTLVSSHRHRILEHRQGRRVEFQQRLEHVRRQLEHSPTNERLLRKATAYQRKVDSLSEELNERQLEHLIARDEWLDEQQQKTQSSRRLRGRRDDVY
jgi:hypothetical protein